MVFVYGIEKNNQLCLDVIGLQKPFYSLVGNNKLVFASEMKAIFPFLNSIKPNEKINFFLQKLFDYESMEDCVISGIKTHRVIMLYKNENFILKDGGTR